MASERHDQLCQCGHVRNAHGGEGACDRCYDEMGQTKEERIGKCPTFRPAAPSEPLAADSPTPGTGTHRMLAGSHEQPGGAECRCGERWDRWNDRCTQPVAPSPVDATEPPADDEESLAERSQRTGECICTSTERMRNRPFPECGGHKPQAETQQDDERPDPLTVWRRGYQAGVKDARERIRLGHDEPVPLAARPSADAETLRRVRELAAEWTAPGRAHTGNVSILLDQLRAALDAR